MKANFLVQTKNLHHPMQKLQIRFNSYLHYVGY